MTVLRAKVYDEGTEFYFFDPSQRGVEEGPTSQAVTMRLSPYGLVVHGAEETETLYPWPVVAWLERERTTE